MLERQELTPFSYGIIPNQTLYSIHLQNNFIDAYLMHVYPLQRAQSNFQANTPRFPGAMAAVVVAIRNKQYDAEEAQDKLLDSKDLINPFPPESEWLGDIILEKLMVDG